MAEVKKVFLSSTGRDLSEYREAAYSAIEGLDGYHCVRMEDSGATDWEADEFCRDEVAECDLFVGILGLCYGSSPKGKQKSYTETEYEVAIAAKLPRLMFLAPDDFRVRGNLIESDRKRNKQRAFRERVSNERVRDTFTSPDDLSSRVVKAIHNWEKDVARTLVPELVAFFWAEACDEALTAGFQGKSHEKLLQGLREEVDRRFGDHVRVSILQSLQDTESEWIIKG